MKREKIDHQATDLQRESNKPSKNLDFTKVFRGFYFSADRHRFEASKYIYNNPPGGI